MPPRADTRGGDRSPHAHTPVRSAPSRNGALAATPYHRKPTHDTGCSDDYENPQANQLGIDSLADLLPQLGYDPSKPTGMYADGLHEFVNMAGSPDGSISLDSFILHASQYWGLPPRLAQAYFFASNVEIPIARLNLREYLLLRAAFIYCPVEHDVLIRLHLRATFHRYTMSSKTWDETAHATLDSTIATGSGVPMTRADAEKWVAQLMQSDGFISVMTDTVLPQLHSNAPGATVTEEEFMQIASRGTPTHCILSRALMQASESACTPGPDGRSGLDFGLALKQTLRPEGRLRPKKVVLSDRAINAFIPGPNGDGDAEPPPAVFRMADVPNDAINAELQLDDQLRAYGDWRGPLAPARDAPEQMLASRLVATAMQVSRELGRKPDTQDRMWALEGQARELFLGKTEDEQADTMLTLAAACRSKLQCEPSLVRVALPAKVFGDIHGQLRDLLMLFAMFGSPTTHQNGDILNTRYVFDGDYVDRGAHQLEVVAVLFALKILFPCHIYLLRGNHEFRGMSVSMGEEGFLHHVQKVMSNRGPTVFEEIHRTFDWLPIAALVDRSVLVLHGGLGAGTWGLNDLEAVRRPLDTDRPEGKDMRVVLDAMWADPADSDDAMRAGVHLNCGRHSSPANTTYAKQELQHASSGELHRSDAVLEWGADITREFCSREGISLIIRAHQLVDQGYKYMHGGRLITLFSARNYFSSSTNDAAVAFLANDINGHLRVYPKRLQHSEINSLASLLKKSFSASSEYSQQSCGLAGPVPARVPKQTAQKAGGSPIHSPPKASAESAGPVAGRVSPDHKAQHGRRAAETAQNNSRVAGTSATAKKKGSQCIVQ